MVLVGDDSLTRKVSFATGEKTCLNRVLLIPLKQEAAWMTIQHFLCCAFMQVSHDKALQDSVAVKPNKDKTKQKVRISW